MNRLSPEAARLFQLAREADNPDSAQVDRVGKALSRRIAGGGVLATSAALLSHAAPATAAISLSKIVAVVVMVGAISSTSFFVMQSRKRPVTNTASVSASSLSVARAPIPAVPSAPPVEPAVLAEASSTASVTPNTPPRALPRVTAQASASQSADQLQAETADLHQAQAALRSGDAALALRLLNAQDAKYGAGVLQQERSAARVLALCQNGNVSAARAESARFEKRWPHSPLTSRVQSACAALPR